MSQWWTYSAIATTMNKGENIAKIEHPDGFAKKQFVQDISYPYAEEFECMGEYGIEPSSTNPMGIAITSIRQTISEEFIIHNTAAQDTPAPVVIDPAALKRLLKTDEILFLRAVVKTTITAPADAYDNARDLAADFQKLTTPQYITSDYEFKPASVKGGGTPKGIIKLRKALSGYTEGALLDSLNQSSSQTDIQSTVWEFTEYWVNEAYQAVNPHIHIFNPNKEDELTANFGLKSPDIVGPGGVPLDENSCHMWTWDFEINLNANDRPKGSLSIVVYPIDNSLD